MFPRARAHREYAAAKQGRLVQDWLQTPYTPDDIIRRERRPAVARSRTESASNDWVKGFLIRTRANILGESGIKFQSKAVTPDGRPDIALNEAVERGWRSWTGSKRMCDQSARLNFLGLQQLALNSLLIDGEILVRKIRGAQAGPHAFRIQLLDTLLLDQDLERETRQGVIRFGIEYDNWDRAIAYWVTDPKNALRMLWGGYVGGYSAASWLTLPADDVVHAYVPDRVGQRRGMPWLSATLYRLHMLGGFEEAALVHARVGATQLPFIMTPQQEGFAGSGPVDPNDPRGPVNLELEPAIGQLLPPGSTVSSFTPNYPSGEFGPFAQYMLRASASGSGSSYAGFANDFANMSFSAARAAVQDEREIWTMLQAFLVTDFAAPLFESWVETAILAGALVDASGRALRMTDLDRVLAGQRWQPRRWAWVDPAKDMAARILAVNARMRSRGSYIREDGDDPDDVWAECAREEQLLDELGIPAIKDSPAAATATIGGSGDGQNPNGGGN